jgi:hypothetical protein
VRIGVTIRQTVRLLSVAPIFDTCQQILKRLSLNAQIGDTLIVARKQNVSELKNPFFQQKVVLRVIFVVYAQFVQGCLSLINNNFHGFE